MRSVKEMTTTIDTGETRHRQGELVMRVIDLDFEIFKSHFSGSQIIFWQIFFDQNHKLVPLSNLRKFR